MKKIAILTSILALAACGGGSGGGHSGVPGEIIKPSDTLSAEQRAAAIASNSEITDMESFIVVGGTNPTVNPNARASGTKLSDGGVRYDLSDVEFTTASMLMNTGANDRGTIKFGTKDGIITTINIINEGLDGTVTREDKTNKFVGNFIYKEDGQEDINGDLVVLYDSKAKEHNLGLKYSDFAVFEWGEPGEEHDSRDFFAGGYDAKEIKSNDIKETMTFTGIANGVVAVGNMGDDEVSDMETHNISTNALLTFNNGTSTLQANFADWYDVTAKMDNSGNLTDLNFSNGDKEGFYKTDKRTFKWNGENEHTAIADSQGGQEGERSIIRDGFVKYYGDVNKPAEAVGVIKYGDSLVDTGNGQEAMRFDMGFGAKRD